MNTEWKTTAQRALMEAGIKARVQHLRANSYAASVEILLGTEKSIERVLLENLNGAGWHLSIVVSQARSQIKFLYYGTLTELRQGKFSVPEF